MKTLVTALIAATGAVTAGCSATVSGQPVAAVVHPIGRTSHPSASAPSERTRDVYVYSDEVVRSTPVSGAESVPSPVGGTSMWSSYSRALTPGESIGTVGKNYSSECTAGIVLRQGSTYVLATAGHCDHPEFGPEVIDVKPGTRSVSRTIGRFTKAVTPETRQPGDDPTDYGVVALRHGLTVDPRIGGRYQVTEVLKPEQVKVGMQLCKIGSTTALTCAPVVDVDATGAVAPGLHAKPGDSGALAFVKRRDGREVAAVGILATARGRSYFLSPVMKRLGLTLP